MRKGNVHTWHMMVFALGRKEPPRCGSSNLRLFSRGVLRQSPRSTIESPWHTLRASPWTTVGMAVVNHGKPRLSPWQGVAPHGDVTAHSVRRAAVAQTVHRGELSPMAKATTPWPTLTTCGVRRGSRTFTAANTAGNHGDAANTVY